MKSNSKRVNKKLRFHQYKILAICSLSIFVIIFSFLLTGFLSNAKDHETENSYKYYTSITIMPGDTLSSIASAHYDSHFSSSEAFIREVMVVNSLEDDSITAGMSLVIPYYSEEFK